MKTFYALALAALVAGCHKEAPKPPAESLPTATVELMPVQNKTYQAMEEVLGTVRPKLHATLEAKISGRIQTMPVVFGQSVKAGDLIAQLEVGEIQAKLTQAKAMLDQAEGDFKRYENLLKGKAVTQQEFDGIQARYRVAAASVKEAETMLGYATVTAPFNGMIARKLSDVGDLATPGRPLVELEDPAGLRLEANVPEGLIGSVHLEAKRPVRVEAVTNELEGVVREIAPSADPNSRTFSVKFDLPAAPGLRSGQFGRVVLPVGETTLPRVPISAVVRRGQMEIVFVAIDNKAQLRLVKTGKRIGDEVELLSGVQAGDKVVVKGAATLIDGQPLAAQSSAAQLPLPNSGRKNST
ncbi:MAG: efflux RND transporter periplasmic adaptor subunit [Candidatus Omnitrophica bacterium]|nr:efflux RND transporter periplasmic adaptor subunit [Candidatus Omnitrophota bacterium]